MFELETYDLGLLVVGFLCLGGVVVPLLLRHRLLTYPIVVVVAGGLLAWLPLPLPEFDPLAHGEVAERVSEFAVIVALTTLGLKIDRRPSWSGWRSTWLLLAITMPLTIAAAAWLGLVVVGLAPATAVLLGACLAPTDPVLAGDVQTGPPVVGDPHADEPDEVRFALTSESALNDGLAFPFTNLAILVGLFGLAPGGWWQRFLVIEVGYKIGAGLLIGWAVGRVLGGLVLRIEGGGAHPRGLLSLAITLLSYGVTEIASGYGFIAVFVTAMVVRNSERENDIHDHLHEGADQLERLAMGLVLLLLGGAVADGLLEATTPAVLLTAVVLVLVVRPAAGYVGMAPLRGVRRDERLVISTFGIRGLGSIYYLAHGLNEAPFADTELIWAVVAWTILISLLLHGLGARPVMRWLDRRREDDAASRPPGDTG